MLKVYNTLTRKIEPFKPREDKSVKMFVCGPTVYDYSHLGHARTYIAFDMIVKYLRFRGYDVFYLQNITDIDDKIINRAREKNISWQNLARKFEGEYFKDMASLKVNSVTKYARATEHIKEIISQVNRLFQKGYAYRASDGIYYDVSKFKDYGKLSGRTALQAEDAVSRIDSSIDKRNKGDFCLWKFWSEKDYEPSWPSPFGNGRPGWHIEDTAITEKYFGPQYDIHGGARDLIFPHHEAEITQMESISGKSPMVKYWFHTGFLTVQGQKMSKSLGNFITIRDFLNKHSARLLRFFVLRSHYRSPVDYSESAVVQAAKELKRIDEFVYKIKNSKYKSQNDNEKLRGNFVALRNPKFKILKFKQEFEDAMEDDFNTPRAIAVIFELIRQVNPLLDKEEINKTQAKEILSFLREIDKFFNFIFWPKKPIKFPQLVLDLAKRRELLRKQKQWAEADKIRQEIEEMGWQIEDTSKGPRISKQELT